MLFFKIVLMVFSDFFFLELLILLISLYLTSSNNIMILLYNAGLYLLLLGFYSLLNDADIYIGFLWVIDLGVGLVFFIFMLHFIPFLHQKSNFNFSKRQFLTYNIVFMFTCFYLYFFSFYTDSSTNNDLSKTWFFHVSYLDYYLIYFSNEITELNLIRETYFLVNGFEFFLVNFSLFFGLITSILLCFLIHRVFAFLNYAQLKNVKLMHFLDSSFFIRNQNFTAQSSAPTVTKIWSRKQKVN